MIDTKDMVSKATRHKAMIDTNKKDIKDNLILIKNKKEQLNNLVSVLDDTKLSFTYLDELIKQESNKFIDRLNDMLNFGVQTIFFDCDYNIEVRIKDNKASIYLKYTEEETGVNVESDILNCGGGIRTVIGFLLQVYFIFYTKSEKVLFVDEGFSQISSQYLERFFGLINELSEKNDLKVLLITHDDRFTEYAKVNYEIRNGKSYLIS